MAEKAVASISSSTTSTKESAKGQFNSLIGVTADRQEFVYINDFNNHC